MFSPQDNTKRSNSTNNNDSKRSNELNSPKEVDINKISNRSEQGSDKKDGLVGTERVEGVLYST